jgi:hypothetical protein
LHNKEHNYQKNINNKKIKIISPKYESVNEDYYAENNMKKLSSENFRNYYKINNHNHCEYITNNSSDFFPKTRMSTNDVVKIKEIKLQNMQDNNYYKTQSNETIKRANLINYRTTMQEEAKKIRDKKIGIINREKRNTVDLSQPFLSQPALFQSQNDLNTSRHKKKNSNSNINVNRAFIERTYRKKNNTNNIN